MRIEKSHIEHVELLEMTAASTLYFDELEPDFGSGNQHKAQALAALVSELKNIKKVLTSKQPMAMFENNRDGSIKTDRNGMPLTSLTALGRRMLALQRLPSMSLLEQMAPGIAFPPYTKAVYTLIDDHVFRQVHEGCLAMRLPDGRFVCQYLNAKLDEARKAAQRKSVREAQELWANQLAKQAKKVEDYISNILDLACPIHISRLELGSHSGFIRPDLLIRQYECLISEAKLQGRFKNLLGYAWRLCLAPAGGYRLHVVLFNNATNMINADNPVRELGTYWEEKIEGGMYWQQFQSPYKQFGCGMFYPSDEHFRDFWVEGLTRFLVKNDACFRPQLPAGMSALLMFGLGEQPRRPTAPNGLDSPLNWRGSGWRRHVYDHAADWGGALHRS